MPINRIAAIAGRIIIIPLWWADNEYMHVYHNQLYQQSQGIAEE